MINMGGIYEIRNITNGVRYIGSAACFKTRLSQHRTMLKKGKHHSIALQRAWSKYGDRSFEMRPVAILEQCELLSTEQRFLDAEHQGETYNIAKNATAWMKGLKHTKEWKENAAERMRGNKNSLGIPSVWKGKNLSFEHREKLKAAKAIVTAETRKKMRDAKLRNPQTVEHIERLRQLSIGRVPSPETIEKRRIAMTGKKMPEGSLAKAWATRRANKLKELTNVSQ